MHETRRTFCNAGFRAARVRRCGGVPLVVFLALVGGLMCALACVPAARSQSTGGSGSGQGQGQGQGSMHPYPPHADVSPLVPDDADIPMAERRIRALNVERQKQIVADTDKLLKLARELNEEVAKANSGTLTQDELHKIADIEKLARNVRQRMTESVGEALPILAMPPQMMYSSPN